MLKKKKGEWRQSHYSSLCISFLSWHRYGLFCLLGLEGETRVILFFETITKDLFEQKMANSAFWLIVTNYLLIILSNHYLSYLLIFFPDFFIILISFLVSINLYYLILLMNVIHEISIKCYFLSKLIYIILVLPQMA